jgi:hypothetical protein
MESCKEEVCGVKIFYIVKIKKSETDDKIYRLCRKHRDEADKECKVNKWEFLEIN